MAFGMSAASAALVGSVAAPVIGGLLGGAGNGSSSTQSNELNPKLAKYVYGSDGNSGLLANAFDLYQKQMQQGGLNDMQRQGLNMQSQFLNSPQYTQGYNQMMQLGSKLMGGGVAANPFTASNPGRPGAARAAAPAMRPFAYQGITPAQAPNYASTPEIAAPSSGAKAYFDANPDAAVSYQANTNGMTPDEFVKAHYEKIGKAKGVAAPVFELSGAGLLSPFEV